MESVVGEGTAVTSLRTKEIDVIAVDSSLKPSSQELTMMLKVMNKKINRKFFIFLNYFNFGRLFHKSHAHVLKSDSVLEEIIEYSYS